MKGVGGAYALIFAPATLVVVFFAAPLLIMLQMSVLNSPPNAASGYTSEHYVDVLTDSLTLDTAVTTLWIVTVAMAVMLVLVMPLAYYMVFKAGKWELFLLLALVIADELAPVVKIYAWQVVLGRNGLLNALIPGPPVEWLLYSPFAVAVSLVTSYLTYTAIPIYAAMKAIDPVTIEAARDLGAGWLQQTRRILVPLAAPGIFIAMILVYVPMFTDFVGSDIVGGPSSYMLGQRVRDLMLAEGNWGAGSALSFVLLACSVLASLLAYRLARLNRLEMT